MSDLEKKISILIAEDDEDHFLLIREALAAAGVEAELHQVKDGVALLEFLLHHGDFKEASHFPRPSLILLDLNLPRKDGRWALKEIKAHPQLKSIPVVALTTTQQNEDIQFCYREGANAFIRKPAGFKELVEAMTSLANFWFKVVQLPSSQN